MHPLLRQTEHRTAPMPRRPWMMVQTWHDLLFAHWPLLPDKVRPLVPQELELDLHNGNAWVGVVPFWMSGVRVRGGPPIPGANTFPELNVRTYVTYRGIPGVYFWSLDAASRLAVWAANTFYRLPYFFASMSADRNGDQIKYRSVRREGPGPADFAGAYSPKSAPRQSRKGDLEHFLTERYCLYTVHGGRVRRAYIHHLPWPLQDAEAILEQNTVALADGIQLPPTPPLLHFARRLEVLIWWPEVA